MYSVDVFFIFIQSILTSFRRHSSTLSGDACV